MGSKCFVTKAPEVPLCSSCKVSSRAGARSSHSPWLPERFYFLSPPCTSAFLSVCCWAVEVSGSRCNQAFGQPAPGGAQSKSPSNLMVVTGCCSAVHGGRAGMMCDTWGDAAHHLHLCSHCSVPPCPQCPSWVVFQILCPPRRESILGSSASLQKTRSSLICKIFYLTWLGRCAVHTVHRATLTQGVKICISSQAQPRAGRQETWVLLCH